MRKLLGKLGEAITRPFLRACLLLLLFSPEISHAQALCAPPSSATITPTTWYAGQVNIVTVTTPNFNVDNIGVYCASFDVTTTNGIEVPITSVAGVSGTASSYTFAIEPAASVPTEAALFVLEQICDPEVGMPCTDPTGVNVINWEVTYPIQIVNCPVPQITAVSPSTWFAGKTYDNVVIKGTGFVTADKATPTCPATTVTIAGGTVSNVSVVDKTKITLTVAPPASDPTQSATITAGTTPPNQATFNTAQILGNIIKCSASMPVCGGTTVSAPHDPPPVVAGQQIALVANPDLPSSITPLNTTWTVGGTRIAGYNPTTGRTSVKELADADLKKTSITFYWPYTETAVPVTYNYCVDIDGAEPKHQCSQDATATFEVDGPTGGTMSFTPFAPAVTIANLTACTDSSGKAWPGGPYMVYATGETGPSCPGKATLTAFGITFNSPTGYSDPSGGAFSLVQLISSDVTTGEGGTTHGPGLDFSYPYSSIFPSSDSPKLHLPATATDKTRTFTANMFLMWQSSTDHSIPVPLGYQTWGFSGTASCSKNCGKAANWTVANTEGTTPGPAASGFVPSAPSQTSIAGTNNILVDGYPTWTGLSQ